MGKLPANKEAQIIGSKEVVLDRSKNYAQILGAPVARYHQDGKDFDIDGKEVK